MFKEEQNDRQGKKVRQPGICQQRVTGAAHHYSTRLYIQCLAFTPQLPLPDCFGKFFFVKGLHSLFVLSNRRSRISTLIKSLQQSLLSVFSLGSCGFHQNDGFVLLTHSSPRQERVKICVYWTQEIVAWFPSQYEVIKFRWKLANLRGISIEWLEKIKYVRQFTKTWLK